MASAHSGEDLPSFAWFTSLAHARAVIEAWRREYNENRPKNSLGGRTPADYAKHLADRAITMPGKL